MGKLVCVNPDATRDYEYEGATFKIGVLKEAVALKVYELQNQEKPIEAILLACRYGIKGHSGMVYEDGSEVPFETETDSKFGSKVSERTMMTYWTAFPEAVSEMAGEILKRGEGPKVRARRLERGG